LTLLHWEAGPDAPPAGLPPFADFANERPVRAITEIPLVLLVAGIVAFLIKTFIAQAFYIPSPSMVPQLKVNDRVVVSKLAYHLHAPRRGDIVVFDCPPRAECKHPSQGTNAVVRLLHRVGEAVGVVQPSTDEYIKRIIGLPGDTVEARGGSIFVNGRQLIEPYLPPNTPSFPAFTVKVPPGRLWVMGDNRTNSSDSRVFGTIPIHTVVGRTVYKVWPFPHASFL
jgi:signal peptidase I